MIDGVAIRRLERHVDERGSLTELVRSDWPEFRAFGQTTLTRNYPGVVRAWHWHERQTDLFVVIAGMMKVVLYDARRTSPSQGRVQELFLGEDAFLMVSVPPGVYHGYKTIGTAPALILNFPDALYRSSDPDEQRIPFDSKDVPYDWSAPTPS